MGIEITDFADRFPLEWQPKSDAQRAALDSPADFLLFGGAAGGGKSEIILVDGLEMYDQANYHAIVFRRTFPELQQLMDRSKQLFQNMGGRFNLADKVWRWPWGATFEFKYLEKDDDIYKRQGAEYHFVGFDESTHFMEKQVRYIINSRMRSKEGYRLKVRCSTNPGNRGAAWHKKVFIGPKCLHCLAKAGVTKWPATSRIPYKLYQDSKWMDGVETGLSTMFIPSKVTDHNIFGIDGGSYAKKMRGLPLAYQLALLEGCWDAFEGQYFDCFNHQQHVFSDRRAIGEKSWWPYWVSIDYGFSMTHATAAYLWTMSPDRHIYTLEEYLVHRRKATDVALDLQLLWSQYNPKAWYLSPDAFRHDGTDDFSRAELMSQATGIGFDEAYNERVSGAMLMYQMLSNMEWSISEDCPLLIASLPTRQHGEDAKAEDIAKAEEDEDDAYDACLIAGTMVTMDKGMVPIHKVKAGDLVMTRQGPKRVTRSWQTGIKHCHTVKFSHGIYLTGTDTHPVFACHHGFVPIKDLDSTMMAETNFGENPTVLGKADAGIHPVFNLEVEDAHEFYANGILVHNCRYGVASHINPGRRPVHDQLMEHVTSQDPTIAMMQYTMAKAKIDKADRPSFYKNGRRSR